MAAINKRYSMKNAAHKAAVAREWRLKNPEKYRALRLWKSFRITPQDYDALFEVQHGLCAICSQPERVKNQRLAVDHDHGCCDGFKSCGQCIRGLLCGRCNAMLGFAKDKPEILERAAHYLRTSGHKMLTGRQSA